MIIKVLKIITIKMSDYNQNNLLNKWNVKEIHEPKGLCDRRYCEFKCKDFIIFDTQKNWIKFFGKKIISKKETS